MSTLPCGGTVARNQESNCLARLNRRQCGSGSHPLDVNRRRYQHVKPVGGGQMGRHQRGAGRKG